ncbi:hypothetical protein I5G67_gp088 [Mycobacterium phage Aminay]|uniref:Uncharacterized protein n=1 Tax=Mycobacterium phage Aminay TaxID=2250291 RepID=A0A345KV72_9CAUD|nr:hypothetical protein I5G67_gp088 [Mycobacterium phage Aminay]AXH46924.1 hypothetical protein SEA_AMINAY_88 [Mycobacterium phage Aminay]
MNTTIAPIASIGEIRVGDSVRTRAGRLDWRVTRVTELSVTIVLYTNDGRLRLDTKTHREIARGALRRPIYT